MPTPAPPTSRQVATLPSGQPVHAWTLQRPPTSAHAGSPYAGAVKVEILNLGGVVTQLWAPDRHGHLADLVLGYASPEAYFTNPHYFGAIAGRVAGRIPNARFSLENTEHPLAANSGPHHVHGGINAFHRRLWTAHPSLRPDGSPSLQLSYHSPHAEEGYPGNIHVTVTYTLTPPHASRGAALEITTHATSDRPTPFSPTHHSYFNLSGDGSKPVTDHLLQICADHVLPTDAQLGPLGITRPVAGTPADLNAPRLLADVIPHLFLNHGDLYALPPLPPASPPRPVARLSHPPSGRQLTVLTNETHLQLYTAADFDGTLTGKYAQPYPRHAGVCLECEGYPNGANLPALGDTLLHPDRPFHRTTVYAFGLLET